MDVEEAHGLVAAELEGVGDSCGHVRPGPGAGRELLFADDEGELALEDVERLAVPRVDVRRGRRAAGVARHLADADLVDVGEERDPEAGPVGDELACADARPGGRPAAVGRRLLLVVDERAAVANRAQVVGEALAGSVEVEVAQLGVASVPEAVDDERRHPGEHPRLGGRGLARRTEPDGQLAGEDVEEVGVPPVHVQVGPLAVRAEARPGRVQLVPVGEDLDPPVGRVADHLASAGR